MAVGWLRVGNGVSCSSIFNPNHSLIAVDCLSSSIYVRSLQVQCIRISHTISNCIPFMPEHRSSRRICTQNTPQPGPFKFEPSPVGTNARSYREAPENGKAFGMCFFTVLYLSLMLSQHLHALKALIHKFLLFLYPIPNYYTSSSHWVKKGLDVFYLSFVSHYCNYHTTLATVNVCFFFF